MMQRAERRKRENEKLLIESAEKIPKLTSFFKSVSYVPANTVVELEADVNCEPSSPSSTLSATVTTLVTPDTDGNEANDDSCTAPQVLSARLPKFANPDKQTSTCNFAVSSTMNHQLRLKHSQPVSSPVVRG